MSTTPNLPPGHTTYEVQFTFTGFDAPRPIRNRTVITGRKTVFEDIRKILAVSLTGCPADLDKIDILTITKAS